MVIRHRNSQTIFLASLKDLGYKDISFGKPLRSLDEILF
jgi:hypothetical protein